LEAAARLTPESMPSTPTTPHDAAPSRRRTALRLLASAGVLIALTVVGVTSTYSAFNAVTTNPGNTFTAGTVTISDNDTGTSALSLTNAKPGDVTTGCVVVTYGGSLPATVRLYSTTTGTGLDAYLTLKITRGTISGTPAPGSCTNFVADSTSWIGAGAGIIFSATLSGFPANSAGASAEPAASTPETWTQGETHAYRLDVTVQNDNAAQGKTATESFAWEAQNS
jgi:predicted ribosomally synthesized peptide with SipW-like signal peptide